MAVTFVVEDGSGLSTATSYISIAELVQYAEDYGYDVSSLTTDALKQQACNKYTQILDGMYKWPGWIVDGDQALQWPRSGATDSNGYYIYSTLVPVEIKKAVVILIVYSIAGTDVVPVQDASGPVKRKYEEVTGAVVVETEYLGTSGAQPSIPELNLCLKKIIGKSGSMNMRVER